MGTIFRMENPALALRTSCTSGDGSYHDVGDFISKDASCHDMGTVPVKMNPATHGDCMIIATCFAIRKGFHAEVASGYE